MGVYLPKPNTEKESEDGGDLSKNITRFGVTAMQGWRQLMEDAHVANPSFGSDLFDHPFALFGVFDGHGGPAVSSWVANVFENVFREQLVSARKSLKDNLDPAKNGAIERPIAEVCEALKDTFLALDKMMTTNRNREELRKLHEAAEEKRGMSQGQDQEESPHRGSPEAFLESFFPCFAGRRRLIRIVEQDGHKYYHVVTGEAGYGNDDDSEESKSSDKNKDSVVEDLDEQFSDASANKVLESSPAAPEESATEQRSHTSEDEKREAHSPSPPRGPTSLGHDVEFMVGFDRTSSRRDEETERILEDLSSRAESDNGVDSVLGIPENVEKLALGLESTCAKDGSKQPATTQQTVSVPNGTDEPEEVHGSTLADTCASLGATDSDSDEDTDLDESKMQPYQPECCGSTAVVAVVVGGEHPMLITANAGDSRGVLCRDGVAIPLSRDHKPCLRTEKQRIYNAGGNIMVGRVDGNLNLSRALGDLSYKSDPTLPPECQKITAFPDVCIVPLCPKDQFFILACDGIWDCLTNQEAVDFVAARLGPNPEGPERLSQIGEEICDYCLADNPLENGTGVGCDNMTVLIVQLSAELTSKCPSPALPNSKASVMFYGSPPSEADEEDGGDGMDDDEDEDDSEDGTKEKKQLTDVSAEMTL